MRCLTICQPYPELILRGLKLVENREWHTPHRGPLLIHAGISKKWLTLSHDRSRDMEYDIALAEMSFGAIVGRCEVVDCVREHVIQSGKRFPELREHVHVNGPWCWVLSNAVRFERPIPYKGALGLFPVPDEVVRAAT